jgi:ABC-type oligopeptide transport system substrate-binding subunit
VADHPDPENFLALFHGRSVPADSTAPSTLNSTRFKDAVYDTLFAHAQRSTVEEERLLSLARAERRAMEQYVVAPLYHERSVRLLQHHVRNLPINGMEHRILRAVWFDPSARTR